MLLPKKVKYRYEFRGTRKGLASRGVSLAFGDYGLKALSGGWLGSAQIEAARRSITHFTKKGGRLWVRIFPRKPVSRKPNEVRMGGGKGPVDRYVAVVRPGLILFEIVGVEEEVAKKAFKQAGAKLPLDVKFVRVK